MPVVCIDSGVGLKNQNSEGLINETLMEPVQWELYLCIGKMFLIFDQYFMR